MQQTSAVDFWQSWAGVVLSLSLSVSAHVFLILTTCFFGGMMVKFDIIVYLIARKTLFHPCQIGWTLFGTRLVFYNADRVSANVITYRRPSGARAIIKFAGDLQIVGIVRRQCYM